MPQRTRTWRHVAILAAGTVAALLAAGPAAAAPSAPGLPRVEFSRAGLDLLSCTSKPSERELTVPAESRVTFVNNLGHDATLRIDGEDAGRVPAGGSQDVRFHHGTVRVEMVPDCGLSLSTDIDEVSVTVLPGGATASSGPPATSSGPASPSGSGRQSSHPPRQRSASASPEDSASASASGVPAGTGTSPSGVATVEEPVGADQAVAAEPVSAEPISEENGPNGLLAIIAIVCIVGVSTGAIRAIVAQRASRTSAA